jgi:hypothetical protein
MKRLACVAILVLAAPLVAQQTRIASDFEIAQMQKQAAQEREFTAQLSAHLNLGDLRATRNETALAESEFKEALNIAAAERSAAPGNVDYKRYAIATMYEGYAYAKLHRPQNAFMLLEEGLRYASDDDRMWNLYAGAMSELGMPEKVAAAARNGIVIAEQRANQRPTTLNLLDLGIARFALATALADLHADDEAIELLGRILEMLRSKQFDALRRQIAKSEAFEIYSSTRNDASAYISLTNRAGLERAKLYETRHDVAAAKKAFEAVLAARSDDPIALAGIARLSAVKEDAARSFAESFDANPFAFNTIADYQQWLKSGGNDDVSDDDAKTTGARVRLAVSQMFRGETKNARVTLDALARDFPGNDVVNFLAARNDIALGDLARARARDIRAPDLRGTLSVEIASQTLVQAPPPFLAGTAATATPTAEDLRALISLLTQNRLTAEQRVALDRVALVSVVRFDAGPAAPPQQTIFEIAHQTNVVLKFAQPTAFNGTFAAGAPLRLTYHVLGVTDFDGGQALLVEPLKLEVPR